MVRNFVFIGRSIKNSAGIMVMKYNTAMNRKASLKAIMEAWE